MLERQIEGIPTGVCFVMCVCVCVCVCVHKLEVMLEIPAGVCFVMCVCVCVCVCVCLCTN